MKARSKYLCPALSKIHHTSHAENIPHHLLVPSMQSSISQVLTLRKDPPSITCSDQPPYHHPRNLSPPAPNHSFTLSAKLLNPTLVLLPHFSYLESPASHALVPTPFPQSSLPLPSRLLLLFNNLLDTRRRTGRTLPLLTMPLFAEYRESALLVCGQCVAAGLPVERGGFSEDVPTEGVVALEGIAHLQR